MTADELQQPASSRKAMPETSSVAMSLQNATGTASAPELTRRAILSGMLIGAILTPCNVYSGLKIGWTFNMSVAAGLLAIAVWSASNRAFGTRPLGLLENNINQTAASSAASIISAGLAAPIPALALLTGQTLAYEVLAIWLFVVSVLGVIVAAGLRTQLLVREKLPFPSGIVTAETMQELHAGGKEAAERLRLLFSAAAFAAGLKAAVNVLGWVPTAPKAAIALSGKVSATRPEGASLMNLGFAIDPSVLMFGFGAISGLRIGASMMIGAVVGWAILAPIALSQGWAQPGPPDPDVSWFAPLVEWLLWPGATLMVVAALTSFAISLARLALRESVPAEEKIPRQQINQRALWPISGVVVVLVVWAQNAIFDIGIFEATLAVLLGYVLAIVAARVSGETAITPIGALGKITQLTFGAVAPGNVTANLMTANVTGGAAGQCADLMHDLRTGQIIGASANHQLIAQLFGILTGALAASFAYLTLIPDPQRQLITPEWPAPAVATWKAVAEVLSNGLGAMPEGATEAMLIAALVGVALAGFESLGPERLRPYVPSASAIGLGFVIPAWNAISLFLGSVVAAGLVRGAPRWAKPRLIVLAAGLIVGESLAGVLGALAQAFV
ncbi:MAG: OPT family oligopeptide transporter [Pseudomonadota bacterium]